MKTAKELQAELMLLDDNLWVATTHEELTKANLEIEEKVKEYAAALKREAAEASV